MFGKFRKYDDENTVAVRTVKNCTFIVPAHIGNNFIKISRMDGIKITPLQLQKLIYFLYATYLKNTGQKLFSEPFQTWSKGPVLDSIYAIWGSYGDEEIKTYYKDSQGLIPSLILDKAIIKRCFSTVWGKYKNSSAEELVVLTCKEGSAWDTAYKNKNPYLDDLDICKDGTELAFVPDKVLTKTLK